MLLLLLKLLQQVFTDRAKWNAGKLWLGALRGLTEVWMGLDFATSRGRGGGDGGWHAARRVSRRPGGAAGAGRVCACPGTGQSRTGVPAAAATVAACACNDGQGLLVDAVVGVWCFVCICVVCVERRCVQVAWFDSGGL